MNNITLGSIFKVRPLMFGVGLAIIDTLLLSATKLVSIGSISWWPYMIIIMVLYGIQPGIFLGSLSFESMSIMNLIWDVMSNIFVSILGIYYFKEKISNMKYLGIILSVISLSILSIDDN
jgi:multidrug transporter EmrE-like cation transporter